MASPDLTIHGAGIFGLAIGWAAARRGARVRVIEVAHPGAGSSGGVVGALAPHVPEGWNDKKAFQLDSLLMAADWWGGVTEAGGQDPGYARLGRMQPVADAAALTLAQARAQTAQDLWRGKADWHVVRTTGAEWEPHSPSGWLIHDTLSARLHPRLALSALLAAIRARGGEVVTGAGDVPQDCPQVWATGVAGLRDLAGGMAGGMAGGTAGETAGGMVGRFGVKGQAALLAHDARDAPQLFVDGVHIVPHANGTVAIGSTSEHDWQDDVGTDAQLDALIVRARAALPVLADALVIDRWAGVRPRSRSRAPVLGAWPGRDGHFVANGGFKIGFGMAPKVAEVMADLVLEGRDAIPDGFRAGLGV